MSLLDGENFKEWYKAFAVGGMALAVGALAAHEKDWALLGLGFALLGFGCWKDQKTQHSIAIVMGSLGKMTKPIYVPSFLGVILTLAGAAVIIRAIWRIW